MVGLWHGLSHIGMETKHLETLQPQQRSSPSPDDSPREVPGCETSISPWQINANNNNHNHNIWMSIYMVNDG